MSKVAVVTGGSAGVGRATAIELAKNGWDVAILARGEAGIRAAVRDVESHGQHAIGLAVDVADAQAVEDAASAVEQQLGPICAWINNAMLSVFSPVAEMTPDEYRRVTDVTYLGVVHGTQAALRRMRQHDCGTIVQVGSALAYRSIPLQSAYCAAKHAVVGFTDSLRSELIHEGSHISLTTVHLPALNTPQFDWVRSRLPHRGQPVPPIFQPEVAARAIVFAVEHPRREFLVGGSTYQAVWGQKFIPGLLDRYLANTAYKGQQTSEPDDPARRDNLFAPVDADIDHGAHGRFGRQASTDSAAFEMSSHRGIVAAALIGATALIVGAVRFNRR
jgi:NAD(P)-dependent dehydrogenase (short-subunit alcohol dehydrogenase family)